MEDKSMTHYEKFIKDRGWEFTTPETLQAAYDRACKCRDGILITEAEFITEATSRCERNGETLKEVYAKLAALVNTGKLRAGEAYQYARFGWCLNSPEAIVAYDSDGGWIVNNCDGDIDEAEAILDINREWGFEASHIKIIGTPYYEASDWKFIRFDCGRMSWLWKGHALYQVEV
jgi:hypothetical protein